MRREIEEAEAEARRVQEERLARDAEERRRSKMAATSAARRLEADDEDPESGDEGQEKSDSDVRSEVPAPSLRERDLARASVRAPAAGRIVTNDPVLTVRLCISFANFVRN